MMRGVPRVARRREGQVEGRPADCVKLAITQLLPKPLDLVVSGINAGSNAGINVLYSGTVAAAIEAAFFGITSIAVSLEYKKPPKLNFPNAAIIGRQMVEQILASSQGLGPVKTAQASTSLVALAQLQGEPADYQGPDRLPLARSMSAMPVRQECVRSQPLLPACLTLTCSA